jgi:VanZ family protein
MGLIFAGSSRSDLPTHPNSGVDTLAKKTIHIVEYSVLAALLWRALAQGKKSTGGAVTFKVLTGSLLYAVSDELHQRFIPGRCGSLADIGFDAVGVLIALVALRRWGWPVSSGGSTTPRRGG